ncbi:hypothetical protein CR513_11501, partial [Mucuna pruriens]
MVSFLSHTLSMDLRGRERVVLENGGTRPTPSASGVAAVASISRRVVAPRALSPLRGPENNWSVKAIRRKTTGTGRMRYRSCTKEEGSRCQCLRWFAGYHL